MRVLISRRPNPDAACSRFVLCIKHADPFFIRASTLLFKGFPLFGDFIQKPSGLAPAQVRTRTQHISAIPAAVDKTDAFLLPYVHADGRSLSKEINSIIPAIKA